jgi:hypothetical protein
LCSNDANKRQTLRAPLCIARPDKREKDVNDRMPNFRDASPCDSAHPPLHSMTFLKYATHSPLPAIRAQVALVGVNRERLEPPG